MVLLPIFVQRNKLKIEFGICNRAIIICSIVNRQLQENIYLIYYQGIRHIANSSTRSLSPKILEFYKTAYNSIRDLLIELFLSMLIQYIRFKLRINVVILSSLSQYY